MALTESQVLANEMERVRPKVPTLFDRDDVFYSTIEKKDVEKVSARSMRVPLELRSGGRFGHFDPDGGDMGLGSGPTFDKALVDVVHLKHAVQWTKKSEWATDDSRKAVVNTFKYLLAKAMSEFRRNTDSLCMSDGTGTLATISAVSTTAGKDTYTLGTDGFGARLLRFDHTYSVYNAALTTRKPFSGAPGGVPVGEAPIDLYDLANKQVRFFGTVAAPAVATDVIVVSGLTATPPVSIQGVKYHHSNASTGFWLGFDRSTTPEIRANRVAAGGALALPFARLAINKIGDRVGKENIPNVKAWMHPCQKQAYEELGMLVSQIHKQPKDEALDLYFGDNMQMAGAPVMTSYSWDKTRIDFVVADVWGRAEMHPCEFYEVDGRKIFEIRGASGGIATSQIFYISASFQPFVGNPAVCSYIDTLTVPSGY